MENDLLKDKKIPLPKLFKRTLNYVKQEWPSLVLALFLVVLNVFCGVLSPRVSGYFTDYISGTNPELKRIIIIAVGMFILSLLSQTFLFIESIILTKAGQRIVYKLRMEVFSHIESMSQNQFNEMPVGSLVTRVCSYTSSLSIRHPWASIILFASLNVIRQSPII